VFFPSPYPPCTHPPTWWLLPPLSSPCPSLHTHTRRAGFCPPHHPPQGCSCKRVSLVSLSLYCTCSCCRKEKLVYELRACIAIRHASGRQKISLSCHLQTSPIIIAATVAQRRSHRRCHCCVTTVTDEVSAEAMLAPFSAAPAAPPPPLAKSPSSLPEPSQPEPSWPEPSLPEISLPKPSLPGSLPVPLPPPAKWTRKAVKRRYKAEFLRDEGKDEDLLLSPHHINHASFTGSVAPAANSAACTLADCHKCHCHWRSYHKDRLCLHELPQIIHCQPPHRQSSPHSDTTHVALRTNGPGSRQCPLSSSRLPTPPPWPELYVFQRTQTALSAASVANNTTISSGIATASCAIWTRTEPNYDCMIATSERQLYGSYMLVL
jgi:hypothetical protein